MSKHLNKWYVVLLVSYCLVFLIASGITFNQSSKLAIQEDLLKQITLETQNKSSQILDLQLKDNRAMLSTIIYNAGFDISNPDNFMFNFWIVNYGNSNADNVTAICKMMDAYGKSAFEIRDTYKSIDANSYELETLAPKIPTDFDMSKKYSPLCYVESCTENCETLYKRIPKLAEGYEK